MNLPRLRGSIFAKAWLGASFTCSHADETQILRVKVERGRSPPSRAGVTGDSTELNFSTTWEFTEWPNEQEQASVSPDWAQTGSKERDAPRLTLLLGQFKSPIILILIGAAIFSIFLQDATTPHYSHDRPCQWSAWFLARAWRGQGGGKIGPVVETKVRVLRDGGEMIVPLEEIVPGDVVLLSAGAIIPGDCRLLEARDLFVNEATLTGETFPVEKAPASFVRDCTRAAQKRGLSWARMWSAVAARRSSSTPAATTEFGKVFESLRLRRAGDRI